MPNAAILTYTGDDGEDEMHVFFPIAWFDAGSWAWAHYFHEWATKGVFMVRYVQNDTCSFGKSKCLVSKYDGSTLA